MLATFMSGDEPGSERFHRRIGSLIWQAVSRGQPVLVFGEMVALLAARGRIGPVLKLERVVETGNSLCSALILSRSSIERARHTD